MARLLNLQTALQQNIAATSRLEGALASDPSSYSLRLMARSLRNQYEQLQKDFFAEAGKTETIVCTYRLFSFSSERYTIDGITTALQGFQRLFTIIYDALLSHRPKQRAIVSSDVEEQSQFGWAYTFPGSLGVVLTLPREPQLFASDSSSSLANAADTLFAMAKSRTPQDVLRYAQTVGSAAIRQLDRWATAHAEAGLGADINWAVGQADIYRSKLFIQVPEIQNLRNAISLSSESKEREIIIGCRLVGADIDRRSFHLKTDTKQDIHGHFVDAITDSQSAQLPADYLARLRVTTKIIYSTEQEEDDYFLISLEPKKSDIEAESH